MNWKELTTQEQLEDIKAESNSKPVAIFKHSTRCNISAMAYERLKSAKAGTADLDIYYLDLIRHRDVSNRIAELFKVHHESPQVLLIRNGECVYDESHGGIRVEELTAEL